MCYSVLPWMSKKPLVEHICCLCMWYVAWNFKQKPVTINWKQKLLVLGAVLLSHKIFSWKTVTQLQRTIQDVLYKAKPPLSQTKKNMLQDSRKFPSAIYKKKMVVALKNLLRRPVHTRLTTFLFMWSNTATHSCKELFHNTSHSLMAGSKYSTSIAGTSLKL